MKRSREIPCLALALAAAFALAGCDDDGGGDEDSGADTETDTETDEGMDVLPDTEPDGDPDVETDTDLDMSEDTEPDGVTVECPTLVEGLNIVEVDGEDRYFRLNLPSTVDTGGPWPVIFNFHGLGGDAASQEGIFSSYVDTPGFSFILVTPEDSDVMLGSLMNIDWDVAEVDAANKEARMFDAILQCVDEQYSVDWSHVHVAGISMGGFCTDVIGTLRSGVVASIATWSGAYGSNEVNLTGSMLAALVSWPEHDPVNTYVQLIAHGDVTDTYDFFVETLHFDVWGDNDRQYLNGLGHDVIFCNHGQGHTIPDDFHGDKLVTFFADHPLGTTDTPYAVDGLPTDLATYCTISESTE